MNIGDFIYPAAVDSIKNTEDTEDQMTIFISNAEHNQFITDRIVEEPQRVLISTFGIYAGLQHDGRDTKQWGEKYRSETREQLELLRSVPKVQILVGMSDYFSCDPRKKQCLNCEMKFIKGYLRLLAHTAAFPEFEWKVSSSLHLKCTLFFYKGRYAGVGGGRNFTDSGWADVTFELSQSQVVTVTKVFADLWKAAPFLTDDTLESILDEQKISTEAMKAMIGIAADDIILDE